ncbi:MAG: glycerol-3-phosphate dehydrogenase/oxidase, partial [Deferrisomatales bacterium]
MSVEPTQHQFDLAVIGGGITGAGVARDAALRGLSCLLLEKGDFAAGTTAKTTRLVHGGLRYLEHGELHLVGESLRERDTLLRNAPHLIHPMAILLPVYAGDPRPLWKIRAGLWVYDLLSLGKGTPHYGVLRPRTALRKAPFLSPQGLAGAGLFYDYQSPLPERLVFENVFSAREYGAYCLNYHEVTRLEDTPDGFSLHVTDRLDGSAHRYHARVVANAAGPWADLLGARYRPGLAPKVRPTKGAHIAVDLDLDHAIFTSSPRDGRMFFAVPLEGLTLVGTTDTPWHGDPDDAECEPADVEYLLDGLRRLLPGRPVGSDDVLWSYAGVRPLAAVRGKGGDPSSYTRRHRLHREG